jgi:hypothetical protein
MGMFRSLVWVRQLSLLVSIGAALPACGADGVEPRDRDDQVVWELRSEAPRVVPEAGEEIAAGRA